MTSTSAFATGTRAAAKHEFQEAQRRYRIPMRKAAPGVQPNGEGGAWHFSTAADLLVGWRDLPADVVEVQIDRCNDVAPLARLAELPSLEVLRIGGAGFVASFEWLPPLLRLRALRLEGFGRALTSLTGIGAAPLLEALVLDPCDEIATVESLAPLASLTQLQLLMLPRISATDSSLQPLAALQKLQLFHGAAFYGPTEYEALAEGLPGLRCPWFSDLAWQLL